MAQENKASMTWLVLTIHMRASQSGAPTRQFEDCLRVEAHYHRPGRFTFRHRYVTASSRSELDNINNGSSYKNTPR
jgi:hypothetical protein